MVFLSSLLLLVASALGQYTSPIPQYQPPSLYQPPTTYHPVGTVTRTNTITAVDCRTQDVYLTNTVVVYQQQAVTVVLCTKNLVTETVYKQLVTPVNDYLVVRTNTQRAYPLTKTVTDVVYNYALATVTDLTTATLTHVSDLVFSTTYTEYLTQTVTRTSLAIRTQVNTRTYTYTTVQTVVNTIVVDAPIARPTYQPAPRPALPAPTRPAYQPRPQVPAAARPVPFGSISDGEVIGFGGEAASGFGGPAVRPQPGFGGPAAGVSDGLVFGFGGEAAPGGFGGPAPGGFGAQVGYY